MVRDNSHTECILSNLILMHVFLQDRMAKLVLSVEQKSNNDQKENKKSKKTPFSPVQINKKDTFESPKTSATKSTKNNPSKYQTPKSKSTKLDDFWGVDGQEFENSPTDVTGTPPAPPSFSEHRRKRTPRCPSETLYVHLIINSALL